MDRRKLKKLAVSICFSALVATIIMPGLSSAGDQTASAGSFSGRWIDADNPDIKMSVSPDGGLYRVTAGDDTFGYRLSCLVKNLKAVCSGDGGQLEGENFLYQSSMKFTPAGTAIESWKAFNNLQTVSGKTVWKRP